MENAYKLIIGIILGIVIIFILFPHHSPPIAGHPYEVRGQYYDYDPKVPLIPKTNNGEDSEIADAGGLSSVTTFEDYTDFYNDYNYKCRGLKDEGTTAHTIAQAAAAGTASREQLLNYYSATKDAMQREENCQASIHLFRQYLWTNAFSTTIRNWDQMHNELNTNMKITISDEEIERTNYNIIASNFNNAIKSCSNSNQVLGTDGMCHKIASPPNLYYP